MDFHKSIARVSTAHICRAAGIERSNPSVLDTLNDILVRYLTLLGETAAKAADSRDSNEADVEDCMLALNACNAVHSHNDFDQSVDDIVEFINWLKSPMQTRMVSVTRPQLQLNSQLASAQGAALAALPSSTAAAAAAAASVPSANSNEYRPIQPIPHIPGLPPPPPSLRGSLANQMGLHSYEDQEALVPRNPAPLPPIRNTTSATKKDENITVQEPPDLRVDWLQSAVNRQVAMGHIDWFVNTEFGKLKDPDPEIQKS